jgi:hypothetical protein
MNTLGACFLALGSLVALGGNSEGQKKPKAKFTVSKETTYATGPLTKDRYINYPAALNKRLSEGVTPANNANVLLWKAFGPHPEGTKMPPQFFKWLGIEAPPERGDYFVPLSLYATQHLKGEPAIGQEQLSEDLERAARRPWTAKDYPHIAAWLKANEKPLAVVLEATRRSHYFAPLVPTGSDGLISAPLPTLPPCREVARGLAARALLRVGEGRHEEAWQDLLACHRLGRLVARGGTLIEGLAGIAIDRVAGDANLAFLAHGKLNAQEVKSRLRDLQQLPPMPSLADIVDLGERFMVLDTMQRFARDGFGALGGGKDPAKPPDPKEKEFLESVDWGPALRTANRWYDRIAATMRLKDRAARQNQVAKLEQDLKKLAASIPEAVKRAGLQAIAGVGPTRQAQDKVLGDVLICLLLPAHQRVLIASDRAEQVQRNLHVAFALAAFRQQHSRYPMQLGALVPDYLPRVPLDLFSGKALTYRPSEKGYILHSIGVNGRDDQGRTEEDAPPGDDLAVHMPLPQRRGR